MNDLNKTVKNLYDRLYRKGHNITKSEIEAKVREISNDGIITDTDKNRIVTHFVEKNNSSMVRTEAGETVDVTPSDDLSKGALPKFEQEQPAQPLDLYKPVNGSAMTKPEATALVFEQVEVMGLDLRTSDIKEIASNLVAQNVAANNAIEVTTQLINSFVELEERRFNSHLNESFNQVIQTVKESSQRKNASYAGAVENLKGELEASTSKYKSGLDAYTSDLKEYFTTA